MEHKIAQNNDHSTNFHVYFFQNLFCKFQTTRADIKEKKCLELQMEMHIGGHRKGLRFSKCNSVNY